ncbi:MAG TPA: helix-turn-helix domain-containing protein [Streptosporangiaceae bacterium]|nr:helix-turn-helix domain-containing protein [Streptosporangiaceae bacterium]
MSNFSDLLDRLIREAGIEGRELARQVPVNPGHISNMRQGKKRASLQVAERLDSILGADGRLVAAALADGLPADRPAVLAAIGAVIDPSETAELARRLRASEVDAGTLDALARTTETLCTQYAYRDPVHLRHEAQQWLSYTGRLLGHRTGLREHRELLVTAGWLTLLTACLEYDSGMAAAAEATRVSAFHLGREAGHAEIVAWSLEIAAWMAHTRHDPQAAITYARAGQEAAPRASVAVQLIAHEARSLGRLGDKRAVTAALDRGHKLLQGVPLAANMVNHFVVDPAKFDFYAMDCLRVVGDGDRAAEHAREVLRAGRGPDGQDISPMRMSEARIALGCVAARRGDLDEAAAWGAEAFRADRKCLPSLALVAGELDDEMRGRYPDARPASEFRDQLAEIRQMLPAG